MRSGFEARFCIVDIGLVIVVQDDKIVDESIELRGLFWCKDNQYSIAIRNTGLVSK